ncbi:MAG: hypothetical protein HY711_05595, partial [Candidatus Melainabacteria bacterium]|nr:hypothetical protein [Candidatus Melainabacteria bacterium]
MSVEEMAGVWMNCASKAGKARLIGKASLFVADFLVALVVTLPVLAQTDTTSTVEAHCHLECETTSCEESIHELSQATTQCDAGHLPMDLSSQTASVLVGSSVLTPGSEATINLSGIEKVLHVGDQVTPAEYAALLQVSSGQAQVLQLDVTGRAIGGSFSLGILSNEQLCSLVIPSGVTALNPAGSSILNIAGSLTANGLLVGLTSDSSSVVNIQAGLVQVGPGGSITTQIPESLLGSITSVNAPLNLSIYSLSDIINAGSITASGVLSLSALGSIINQLPSGVPAGTPVPVMAGVMGVNLLAGSGVINNAGLIASQLGNVNINTVIASDLLVNNLAGQIVANTASVNFRDPSFLAKNLTQLNGGIVEAQSINFFGGDGLTKIVADELRGPVDIGAGEAHVLTAGGSLDIARMALTGDPTIVNTGGPVTLNPNDGTALRFAGQDLAVLASGDINLGGGLNLIDLSSAAGNAGKLTIAAGFVFAPATGGQVQ